MFEAIFSVIGAGLSGSGVKIVAGLLQNIFDAAQQRREFALREYLAKQESDAKAYEIQHSAGGESVKLTRRVLALSVCWTWCAIAIYCTIFPDIPLVVVPTGAGEPTTVSILWGLYERTLYPAVETLAITTGTMAYASIHFAGFVLGFYFTPIGKR